MFIFFFFIAISKKALVTFSLMRFRGTCKWKAKHTVKTSLLLILGSFSNTGLWKRVKVLQGNITGAGLSSWLAFVVLHYENGLLDSTLTVHCAVMWLPENQQQVRACKKQNSVSPGPGCYLAFQNLISKLEKKKKLHTDGLCFRL